MLVFPSPSCKHARVQVTGSSSCQRRSHWRGCKSYVLSNSKDRARHCRLYWQVSDQDGGHINKRTTVNRQV
eukprot:6465606-Amphidinium_carterae.1